MRAGIRLTQRDATKDRPDRRQKAKRGQDGFESLDEATQQFVLNRIRNLYRVVSCRPTIHRRREGAFHGCSCVCRGEVGVAEAKVFG
jgi:hypothetical protein